MAARIAVVTGAGSGIGRAIALGLAGSGARVVDADRRAEDAAGVAGETGGITAAHVDIACPDSVAELRGRVSADYGAPTVLVNAAGWDEVAPFLETTSEFAEKIVAINYLGPLRMCHEFLPGMVETGQGGRVVSIASDAGRVGSSGESIYAGAKGGVIALSKSLAREMARHQITVNVVCPGPTDTPLFGSLPEKLRAGLTNAIPFHRLAQPEEVAAAALFFASDAAAFVTGQVLSVSGGLTMAG
jgi:2-hydroxycyclohexanecarboxyl-CoA dehydrogenase